MEIAKREPTNPTPYTQDQIALIKRTVCPADLTDDEFALFLEIAKRKGLDPLQRQIHAVKRSGGPMTTQTGIDGYRAIAQRHGLAGIDDAQFRYADPEQDRPVSASVTVYRRQGEHRDSYTATAYWAEYYPGDGGQGFMWRKMPHGMLAKCAESLALRKGFQELAGVYTEDEMGQEARREPLPSVTQLKPKGRSLNERAKAAGYASADAARKAYEEALEGVVPTAEELARWLEGVPAPVAD
jgi:phage recombination protein Bet